MPPQGSGITHPVVWAVADSHVVSYLVPRDCPRIAIRQSVTTTPADVERFMGSTSSQTIVFIERAWLRQVEDTPLWLYALPAKPFELVDANAGYFVSRQTVLPLAAHCIASPFAELTARGAELRAIDRLRPLAEEVAASSLAFSIIRLRNAA